MLTEGVKSTFKDAAKKLTGSRKRDFMAKVTEDYFEGSARKAESILGWNRISVKTGLNERKTGITCVDNYKARGNLKSEQRLANLETDIRTIVDNQSQADPQMRTTFAYTQISARAVREALVIKGYKEGEFVSRQTIGEVLNRLGYRLKKTKKPNP